MAKVQGKNEYKPIEENKFACKLIRNWKGESAFLTIFSLIKLKPMESPLWVEAWSQIMISFMGSKVRLLDSTMKEHKTPFPWHAVFTQHHVLLHKCHLRFTHFLTSSELFLLTISPASQVLIQLEEGKGHDKEQSRPRKSVCCFPKSSSGRNTSGPGCGDRHPLGHLLIASQPCG